MRKFSFSILLIAVTVMCTTSSKADEPKSWTDKVTISGDFRYRHELISDNSSKTHRIPQRDRERIRMRLAIQAGINKWWDLNARLASGTGDPISTNQDMGGSFVPKQFWIDRAFAEIHNAKKNLIARGGKMGVPFESTDLVWDGDLNMEGIAVMPKLTRDNNELFLRAGGFWGAERPSSSGPDQGLFGGQIGARHTSDMLSGMLAIAYYDWGNVKNGPIFFETTSRRGSGNTIRFDSTTATYRYVNDYNLLDVNAQIGHKHGQTSVTVLGDFVMNSAAKEDASGKKNDTGWLAGLSLAGKVKNLGWELAYTYRDLQKDAVMGAFTDSDHIGGGTNLNGHRIMAYVTPAKNVRVGFTYLNNTKDPKNTDTDLRANYQRLQADLELKF